MKTRPTSLTISILTFALVAATITPLADASCPPWSDPDCRKIVEDVLGIILNGHTNATVNGTVSLGPADISSNSSFGAQATVGLSGVNASEQNDVNFTIHPPPGVVVPDSHSIVKKLVGEKEITVEFPVIFDPSIPPDDYVLIPINVTVEAKGLSGEAFVIFHKPAVTAQSTGGDVVRSIWENPKVSIPSGIGIGVVITLLVVSIVRMLRKPGPR